MLSGALQNGMCTIFPTSPNFSSAELLDMVSRCSLTRLRQFGSFLSNHFRSARSDSRVLDALRSLHEVLYVGIAISKEDEALAFEHGVKLHNMFGTTEMGAMLYTAEGECGLRQIPGTDYAFWPTEAEAPSSSEPQSELFELVILSSSLDCPHAKLRHADGHYHTGDLFEQIEPGLWRYRFRNDDWIKMESSLRCDTLAIEDEVRTLCADLVADCIVVGSGRPTPALFVEPASAKDDAELKEAILARLDHIHSGRYMHERIVLPQFIVVVPAKALPRTATKGNIRRKAVEDVFRAQLDAIYNTV
jgi:acyl-coenzyme A synthetase/AMP-(fatty) acid ligase